MECIIGQIRQLGKMLKTWSCLHEFIGEGIFRKQDNFVCVGYVGFKHVDEKS